MEKEIGSYGTKIFGDPMRTEKLVDAARAQIYGPIPPFTGGYEGVAGQALAEARGIPDETAERMAEQRVSDAFQSEKSKDMADQLRQALERARADADFIIQNKYKGILDDTLKERGKIYGAFISNSGVSQALKEIVRTAPKWGFMDCDEKEAIEVIIQKISRIVTGNSHYADNWLDISGYAKLVFDRLQGTPK